MKKAQCSTPSDEAEKYRQAAKLMETGVQRFCCYALGEVALDCANFSKLFKPTLKEAKAENRTALSEDLLEGAAWGWFFDQGESQDGRILALCFMAAMVEAGDA